jgi:hypothetical protein
MIAEPTWLAIRIVHGGGSSTWDPGLAPEVLTIGMGCVLSAHHSYLTFFSSVCAGWRGRKRPWLLDLIVLVTV